MGADEPGFDVAEQRTDDREERAPALAAPSWTTGVFQMLTESGLAAAITREPVGQEMDPAATLFFEEGAELGTRRGRQHRDAGVAG